MHKSRRVWGAVTCSQGCICTGKYFICATRRICMSSQSPLKKLTKCTNLWVYHRYFVPGLCLYSPPVACSYREGTWTKECEYLKNCLMIRAKPESWCWVSSQYYVALHSENPVTSGLWQYPWKTEWMFLLCCQTLSCRINKQHWYSQICHPCTLSVTDYPGLVVGCVAFFFLYERKPPVGWVTR